VYHVRSRAGLRCGWPTLRVECFHSGHAGDLRVVAGPTVRQLAGGPATHTEVLQSPTTERPLQTITHMEMDSGGKVVSQRHRLPTGANASAMLSRSNVLPFGRKPTP
jgi:hypothetical protein